MTEPTSKSRNGRVPLLAGHDDPALAAIFTKVATEMGAVPNLYRALGHSPELLQSWIDYAWSLRAGPEVDRGLRELAILRLAQLTGCDYVWRSHWRAARQAGYQADQLLSLTAWSEHEGFSSDERAALGLTDELGGAGKVGDVVWSRVVATFGVSQAMELLLTVTWYINVARVVTALGVPLEDGHERAPAVPPSPTG